MFAGSFNNKLDTKDRCMVPAKFRRDLGDSCMLVRGYEECLFLYPMDVYEQYIKEHIVNRPDEDDEARLLKTTFFRNVHPCDIDPQGRIKIPKHFIEHAGIKREMVNVGAYNRVEIWSREKYDETSSDEKMDLKKLISAMDKYVAPGTTGTGR